MVNDKIHEQRLKKMDVVISTDYFDNGSSKTRCSDHSRSDDVSSGVILAKKYFLHGKLLHQETEFNPGLLYSFVFPTLENGKVRCPNCGGIGENALFSEGCPYCGAFYNMEYQSELLGRRDHSDYVIQEQKGPFLPLIMIIAVCMFAGMFYTVTTGRTSTIFDYGKGALIGSIIGAVIYLIYSANKSKAALTSKEIKKKHEQDIILERFQRDLKENSLTMSAFANNLNLELRDYYFGSDTDKTRNIIDFDILDYRGQNLFKQDNYVFINTDISIRLISRDEEKICVEEANKRIRLKKSKNAGLTTRAGLNITKCPYCGASIDMTTKKCSYCGTTFSYERPLYIDNISEI